MAEQGCLLSSCRGNSTEGSNPSLSANPRSVVRSTASKSLVWSLSKVDLCLDVAAQWFG